MARVMTYARTFPAYHPKAGKPTYFVEQLQNAFTMLNMEWYIIELPDEFVRSLSLGSHGFKYHTIRSGNRWKVGDRFSPRVWSGKPYRSKMITLAPDVEIKKVWDFEIKGNLFHLNGKVVGITQMLDITKNDGLNNIELVEWLKYPNPFKGQIICWNENINY